LAGRSTFPSQCQNNSLATVSMEPQITFEGGVIRKNTAFEYVEDRAWTLVTAFF